MAGRILGCAGPIQIFEFVFWIRTDVKVTCWDSENMDELFLSSSPNVDRNQSGPGFVWLPHIACVASQRQVCVARCAMHGGERTICAKVWGMELYTRIQDATWHYRGNPTVRELR